MKTIGNLKLGYGSEYTSHIILAACYAEMIRLIDMHNDQMTTGALAPK